jgi:hypothetical protein
VCVYFPYLIVLGAAPASLTLHKYRDTAATQGRAERNESASTSKQHPKAGVVVDV